MDERVFQPAESELDQLRIEPLEHQSHWPGSVYFKALFGNPDRERLRNEIESVYFRLRHFGERGSNSANFIMVKEAYKAARDAFMKKRYEAAWRAILESRRLCTVIGTWCGLITIHIL
jgi:hypothetical protein